MEKDMTPQELARERSHAEVELVKTFRLGTGELQRWRPKGYMDASLVNIYCRQDGTLLVPTDDIATLSEVLRDVRPPLDSPGEFVRVFNMLVGPDTTELTGPISETKARRVVSWPPPSYSAGALVFVVGNLFRGSVERVTVSGNYEVRVEVLRTPDW
jgi:hypothetical protein